VGVVLLRLWLRIALVHLRLYRGIWLGISGVLVSMWLLLLLLRRRSVGHILAVCICLRRPVVVISWIHGRYASG
jgi:hypothetical protein